MGAAVSAEYQDVQDAVDAASDGDTVTVPSGTETWGSSLSLPDTKGISLIGAGIGNTVITLGDNPVDWNTATGNSPARISGFTFKEGSSSTTSGAIDINDATPGAQDWRIDHCRFDYQNSKPFNSIGISGYTWGVIDNCSFYDAPRAFFIEFGFQDSTDPLWWGDYSWTQASSIGTANAVYIESCYFENDWDSTAQAVESQWGARYVFRYNTVREYYAIETHSGCTVNGRNPFSVEIYENDMDCGAYTRRAILLRGVGQAIVHNNEMTSNYNVGMHMDYEMGCRQCGNDSDASPWYPITPMSTEYPGQDAIGRGQDSGFGTAQTQTPWYEWDNTRGSSATHFVWNTAQDTEGGCTDAQDLIQENRDYYQGTSLGSYTPYTYPHPLRGEGEGEKYVMALK